MLKRYFLVILAVSLFFMIPATCSKMFPNDSSGHLQNNSKLNYDYVKAVWLSQFDMSSVYTDRQNQRDITDYTQKVKEIVKNVKDLGFNTVFIQLRPNGDSIYPSTLFPPSKYACGSYSKDFEYDPFDIFLKLARESSLSVHAWINPLRCMTENEMQEISKDFLISKWHNTKSKDCLVNVDGRYYLNPAYAEVRKYVCNGVAEILEKYNVDGIHIDDYFYPTTSESFDKISFREYKANGGRFSLEDYRRSNINDLVKELYQTVKKTDPDAIFGISPSGNTSRNYNELYADVALWCSEKGYIDYVCPQVYFGFEHESCAFIDVCKEFSNMITEDSVKLIIGMTLGKAVSGSDNEPDKYAGAGAVEWIENKDILLRSLQYTATLPKCRGVAYFSYQYFYDPVTNTENEKATEEKNNLLPIFKEF